jgi:hypothetical protein
MKHVINKTTKPVVEKPKTCTTLEVERVFAETFFENQPTIIYNGYNCHFLSPSLQQE